MRLENMLREMEARPEFVKLREGLQQHDPLLHAFLAAEECSSIDELAECYDICIPYFTAVKKAGSGGFGLIYKAVHKDGPRAIKILTWPKKGLNPKVDYAHTIFGEEGIEANERIVDIFRHQNIVRYYGAGALPDGTKYLVFEWINGINLEKRGKVSAQEFEQYIPQVLHAIAHIHKRGYLHNDIRRPNIMIDTQDGEDRVTVLDYTIACKHNNGISERRASLAAREVIAPEALQGGFLSVQTDIWALGNLMYQMLTGEHPFPSPDKESLAEIVQNADSYATLHQRISVNIPAKYGKIIEKCLAYKPEERYHSVDEVLADIRGEPKRHKYPLATVALGLAVTGLWFCQPAPEQHQKSAIVRPEPMVWQFPQRIQEGEDKYASCVSLPVEKRDPCMNFRDAEELLDKREYERAALVLEDVLAKDQSDYRYHAALLHAYAEMGRITEAYDVLQEIQRLFPDQKHIREVAVYAPEIRAQLVQSGPGFRAFTTKQCNIPFIAEKYPECLTLVAAASLEGEEAIAAYAEIVTKHPHSSLAHHALGSLLIKEGEKKTLPGNVIVYDNIEAINEALAHYKRAAEITGNPDGIFRDIGKIFRDVYHDHALAFLFYYKGRLHKNSDDVDADIARELIDINKALCISEGNLCSAKPEAQYDYLAKRCTTDDWTLQNCPNWQNIPHWKPPKD